MALNLKEKFERSCRLCAEEQDVTLLIFSAEAEAMLLQNKLNKYLLIEVDEDDKLPKNICIQCCTKLQTVCDFIDIAHKSQEVLLNRSIELDQMQDPLVEFDNPHNTSTEIKTEPENSIEDESKITSMEISVDPMMVLQNCEAMLSPSVDNSCHIIDNHEDEDVAHLHGLDGEDVTIKLIKRGSPSEIEKDNEETLEANTCEICARSFRTEFGLKNHYWTHDSYEVNKQDYTCGICNEEFVYKNKLIEHLKVHKTSGVCKICGRLFRSEEKLLIHMACVHSSKNNKSFTCKICGRSYDTLGNLKAHSVAHSNERPYECHFCQKSFKRNQDLKFHINQHTGAKPYKCPFCDKAFASSGNCYSHRSRMHPGRTILRSTEAKKVPIINEAKQYPPTYTRPIAPKPPSNTRPIAPKPLSHTRPITPKPPTNTVQTKPVNILPKPIKYKCPLCAHTFMKRENFTYHMYQHTGEKPFHCSFCTEKFVTRRGLLIHHDNKHPSRNRPLALLTKNVLLM